jgi:hypothetical protein
MPTLSFFGGSSGFGFSRIQAPAALYVFTSFTFTNAGIAGRLGPTLSNCLSSYNTTTFPWLNDTAFFNVATQGIQLWTVPETGTYRIAASGARGGRGWNDQWGRGAIIQGDFELTVGQKLRIMVGQQGVSGGSSSCGNPGGGGGGTFIIKETGSTTSDILVIAGGGGGGSTRLYSQASVDATSSNNGNKGDGTAGGAGGTGGNGGSTGTGCVAGGFGAGGFVGNGTNGTSFVNGGFGGSNGVHGGFGGGGSTGQYCGGGGGGYSGGGGGGLVTCSCADLSAGGGGGSYNNGSNQSALVGASGSTGHGQVVITKL